MNINSSDVIAGQNILRIRYLLRELKDRDYWSVLSVQHLMSVSPSTAGRITRELSTRGLIEPTDKHPQGRHKWYRTSIAGNKLANASAVKPVTRAKVEKTLTELAAWTKDQVLE